MLFPPRIGDTHRNRAFMPTAQVDVLQLFGDGGVNLFTLQVVVDLRVGDAELVLIGAPGDTVEQVGCRRLSLQPFGCAQNPQKQLILPFVQSGERQYIRPSVAELREETGHGFRRVVGSDDQQGRVASERILGDHAGTRLNISLVEVADGRAHGSRVGGVEAIDRIRNIEGDGTVGGDEFEGFLCVFFVDLGFIGQAHRHELSLVSFSVEFFAGELAEPARQCGIDAAANASTNPWVPVVFA